jgi:hypothetical protein
MRTIAIGLAVGMVLLAGPAGAQDRPTAGTPARKPPPVRAVTYQADLGGPPGRQVTVRFSEMTRARAAGGGFEVRLKGAVVQGPLDAWAEDLRRNGSRAFRTVTVRRIDGGGTTVERWTLSGARPAKYDGPTLDAKGGGDVAMEELVLACERIDPP